MTRHGPHHGAQKSTMTGSSVDLRSTSNVAASGTSTGSRGGASVARHAPQRLVASRFAERNRLVFPHDAHGTRMPVLSRVAVDIVVLGDAIAISMPRTSATVDRNVFVPWLPSADRAAGDARPRLPAGLFSCRPGAGGAHPGGG